MRYRGVGSVRMLCGDLVVVLGLLLWPQAASAMLAGPSLHGLAVGANEVAVRVGSRVLFFDHEGTFRREMTTAGVKLEGAHLLTLTDDGRLWLSYGAEDKDGKVTTTTLAALDDSGDVVASHRLNGEWTFYVTPRGLVYAGHVQASTKHLTIARLDPASGRQTPHAAVAIENPLRILDLDTASAVGWAVDDGGDLFVLTTAAERGRVTQYHPSGQQVRAWDVLPDPVTSVSYLKTVLLDREGVPYVTHSSWEVSSATTNSGSVIRLDPAGGEPLRFKEGIDYLQDAAIAPSGDGTPRSSSAARRFDLPRVGPAAPVVHRECGHHFTSGAPVLLPWRTRLSSEEARRRGPAGSRYRPVDSASRDGSGAVDRRRSG